MELERQIVGNAGLYYVCYQLSLRGWNAMPTARNARGIDVVAYSRDGRTFLGIQVKALSRRNPVPLGTSIDRLMGDFWVIIYDVASNPTACVLIPSEVRQAAQKRTKEGRVSYWLPPDAYDREEFREAWHRLNK